MTLKYTPRRPSLLTALALAVALAVGACSDDSAPAQIEAGKQALQQKKTRDALVRFKAALQKDPQSGEARYLLGDVLLQTGDIGGAVVELSKAQDLHYEPAKVAPALARAMLQGGDTKRLVSKFADLKLADANAQAALLAVLADAWDREGNHEKAMAALDGALKAAPQLPAALLLDARRQAHDGHVDTALATVDGVLAREPGLAEAWHLKGEFVGLQKQDLKAGTESFERAIAADPAYVPSHIALINIAMRDGNKAAAQAQADKLRAVLPHHPQLLYIDARLALLDKQVPKARELAQQLLRIAPDNIAALLLGGLTEGLSGSLVTAEAYLTKASSLDPNRADVRRLLAKTYLQLGQPSRALTAVEPLVTDASRDGEAMGLAGEAQLRLGDARAAEGLFRRAAQTTPEDAKPQTALALIRLGRGEVDAAFAQLDSISSQSKSSAADMAIVAERMKRREYDKALEALDAAAKKSLDPATVAETRGQILAARKDYAGARAAFESALKLAPTRFGLVTNLATLDMAEGKPADARKRLEAAVAADARNHVARLALADLMQQQGAPLADIRSTLSAGISASPEEASLRLRLIELLMQRKQFKDALTVAQEAVATLPQNADILDATGRAQAAAGDALQAQSTFRKLGGIEPRSPRAQLRLAELLRRSGKFDDAIAALRRALEIEPGNATAQAGLIETLSASGKPRDALAIARSMQQQTPRLSSGYLLEGAVLRRSNDNDGAIAIYRKGLQNAAQSSELAIELYNVQLAAKKTADAEHFATDYLKSHPDDLTFQVQLATVALATNSLERAEALLVPLQVKLPTNPMVLNNLAWLLTRRGKPGAVAYAQKAVDLLPNRPALLDTLAMALAADKQFPKALETQRKAIEIAPSDLGLRFNLARIAIDAGDKSLARTELERLAAQSDKLPYQREAARLLKTL